MAPATHRRCNPPPAGRIERGGHAPFGLVTGDGAEKTAAFDRYRALTGAP